MNDIHRTFAGRLKNWTTNYQHRGAAKLPIWPWLKYLIIGMREERE